MLYIMPGKIPVYLGTCQVISIVDMKPLSGQCKQVRTAHFDTFHDAFTDYNRSQ